jgi:hypothetical protein
MSCIFVFILANLIFCVANIVFEGIKVNEVLGKKKKIGYIAVSIFT